MSVEFGMIRCVCPECDCDGPEGGNPQAEALIAEVEAAIQGISCCFSDEGPCGGREYKITNLEMVGPQGTCAGFKLTVLVQHNMACCPPATESA